MSTGSCRAVSLHVWAPPSSPPCCRRIQKEIKLFQDEPPDCVLEMFVDEGNMSNIFFLIEAGTAAPREACMRVCA